MGVGRSRAKDFAPSTRPESGEMISSPGTVLVGAGGRYIDLAKLQADVDSLRKILGDEDFISMLQWYKAAKQQMRKLGVDDSEMSGMIF